MIMGCYGIGVNRILACAIEQGHDAAGIIWPAALAPMQVVISVMESGNAELSRAAEALYGALTAAGLEVLLDDREQSPGSKLKDADLIGLPVQVVMGKVWLKERKLEVRRRATKEQLQVPEAACAETIHKLLLAVF
jgi:prolyl-tRNA synthetase